MWEGRADYGSEASAIAHAVRYRSNAAGSLATELASFAVSPRSAHLVPAGREARPNNSTNRLLNVTAPGGGMLKGLTWHAYPDSAVGKTRDGKLVLDRPSVIRA